MAIASAVLAQDLPNQVAVRVLDADGAYILQGWHADRDGVPDGTILAHRPDDPAYAGARVWQMDMPTDDPLGAARASVAAMGMAAPVISARAELDPNLATALGDGTRLVALGCRQSDCRETDPNCAVFRTNCTSHCAASRAISPQPPRNELQMTVQANDIIDTSPRVSLPAFSACAIT